MSPEDRDTIVESIDEHISAAEAYLNNVDHNTSPPFDAAMGALATGHAAVAQALVARLSLEPDVTNVRAEGSFTLFGDDDEPLVEADDADAR